MRRMIIVNNHPDMYKLTGGQTIVFTETEAEYETAIQRMEICLALGEFSHCIPTATSAEIYLQRGSADGCHDATRRDYLFTFEYKPHISREIKLAEWEQRFTKPPLGAWFDRSFGVDIHG